MSNFIETQQRYEKLRLERRLVSVPVDVNIFGTMLIEGIDKSITVDGLPKDAIFVSVERDVTSQSFSFIYLHESFDPVAEGVNFPFRYVTLTRHNK